MSRRTFWKEKHSKKNNFVSFSENELQKVRNSSGKFLAGLSILHFTSPEENLWLQERELIKSDLTNHGEKSLHTEGTIFLL